MKRAAVALLMLSFGACRASSDPAAPPPGLAFGIDPAWPERGTYPGVGTGRLLVTNSRDDTVSLLELEKVGQATLPEVARVQVGLNPVEIEAPHHAAISPDGKHWYTGLSKFAPGTGAGPHGSHGTGTADGQVLKLRTSDNVVVAVARVDRNPGDIVLSPDGKLVAVSHFDLIRISEAARGVAPDPDARIALLDGETLERIEMVRTCAAPHGMTFSTDGGRLYVACYSDEVAIIDLKAGGYPVTRVKVAGNAGTAFTAQYQPYAVMLNPVTGDVFVSCLSNGEVRVLSGATLTMDASRVALVGGTPYVGDVGAGGLEVFVPHQGDDRISVIEAATGLVSRVLSLPRTQCTNVHQVRVLPNNRLAVVCEGNRVTAPGSVLIVDATSGAVQSATEVGIFPDWVGVISP
ncbi:MAG: hypothetical protein JNK82_22915 [Myxococcaceae bacterium]|nr:hypothetical protein [Myxococcaceae bacterium]